MKNFLKKHFESLLRNGVIEQMFDSEYPTLSKAWVRAVTVLADNHSDRRFLTSPGISIFARYKIHPLKGAVLLFRYLRQITTRGA